MALYLAGDGLLSLWARQAGPPANRAGISLFISQWAAWVSWGIGVIDICSLSIKT